MNTLKKPVFVIRNPLHPKVYKTRRFRFLNLVLVGTSLDGGQIYASCVMSGERSTYEKVEAYLRKRFGMVIN